MNISDFKAEFSVLLKRCVASPIKVNSASASSPPSHQELLDAVRDELRAVLGVKLQYLDEAALKTPANNEIVVATPDAPDVLRVDYNQNASMRFESFNGASGLKLPGHHHALHTHFEEKAQVLDNDHENNNNKEAKNANLHSTAKQDQQQCNHQQKQLLSQMVEESQLNLQKVASSLRRIADIVRPEPQHAAVRRLSTILNPASAKKPAPPSTTSHQLRSTIQRAKAARRSLAAAAGDDVVTTPTTSRPSLGPLPPMTKKPAAAAPVSKLAQHSVSMWSLVGDKPKSPVKVAKNPKYAHVQSTIPRPVVAKKKAT